MGLMTAIWAMQAGDNFVFGLMRETDSKLAETGRELGDGYLIPLATGLACVFALCVVGRMAMDMMLRQKRLDVLRLMRPLLFALVIANWQAVCGTLTGIVRPFERTARTLYEARVARVQDLRMQRMALCDSVIAKIDALRTDITLQKAREAAEEDITLDDAERLLAEGEEDFPGSGDVAAERFGDIYKGDLALRADVAADNLARARFSMMLEKTAMAIGELLWASACAFIFLLKHMVIAVLTLFGPVAMAMSVAGPWKDEWSEWLAKFIQASLYVMIAYIIMAAVLGICQSALRAEVAYLARQAVMLGGDLGYGLGDLEYSRQAPFVDMVTSRAYSLGVMSLHLIAIVVGAYALLHTAALASVAVPAKAVGDVFEQFVEGFMEDKRSATHLVISEFRTGRDSNEVGGRENNPSGTAAVHRLGSDGSERGTGDGAAPDTVGPGPVPPATGGTAPGRRTDEDNAETGGTDAGKGTGDGTSHGMAEDAARAAEEVDRILESLEGMDDDGRKRTVEELARRMERERSGGREPSLTERYGNASRQLEEAADERRRLERAVDEFEKAMRGGYVRSLKIARGYDDEAYERMVRRLEELRRRDAEGKDNERRQ